MLGAWGLGSLPIGGIAVKRAAKAIETLPEPAAEVVAEVQEAAPEPNLEPAIEALKETAQVMREKQGRRSIGLRIRA